MSLLAKTIQELHEDTGGLQRFMKGVDPGLIEQALLNSDVSSKRRRILPADTTVWLMVGMALFPNESIQQVAKTLGIGGLAEPTSSSISEARERLGTEPLQWLCQRLGNEWSGKANRKWRGLTTFGIDGTVLTLQDTKANVAAFGKPGSRKDKSPAAYPQARIVGLMELSGKFMIDAEIAPLSKGENTALRPLFDRISDNSITILDRGFQSRENFYKLHDRARNRHFLCRVKSTFKPTWVKDLTRFSWLGRVAFTKQERAQDPMLPETMDFRIIEYKIAGHEDVIRVATSLLDENTHPAKELADLYHLRWEFELGLRDMKTTLLLGKDTLRSKKPDGVRQEIWAILFGHNLVRREMAVVAAKQGVSPTRISFKTATVMVLNLFKVFSSGYADLERIPDALRDLRLWLWKQRLPVRDPERTCPRWVKQKQPSKFPKKPATVAGV